VTKRRVIGATVALVVVAAVVAAMAIQGTSATEVQTARVTRTDLAVTVSAAGSVGANDRVDVYPPTTGILASVEVTSGQEVKAGDVLAVMETDAIEAQVSQAEAAYAGTLAQRDAIVKAKPGSGDLKAATAAVDAAYNAYKFAKAAYDAAVAGAGAPTESDIAAAQSQIAAAQAAAEAASTAYEAYLNEVYLSSEETPTAQMETTLAALLLVKNQAAADLVTAQKALAALMAMQDNSVNIAQAKAARDQAYAAYLAAVAQKEALGRAGDTGGALSSADAAVEAAAQALALVQGILEDAIIKAPADGYVLFGASAGSLAGLTGAGGTGAISMAAPTAGSSVTPAAPLCSVVSFDTMVFTAQVDEVDVAQLTPGMPAIVTLDAFSDAEFDTAVEEIGRESELTLTGGTVYPVTFTFDTLGEMVLLGMNGSVEIEVEKTPDAIAMPVEALLEQDAKDYAFVVRDGRAQRVEITVGRMTDMLAEVTSGLAEGDEVIVSGVAGLEDGARVTAK